MATPTAPISKGQYKAAGIPWFDYYDSSAQALAGSSIFDKVKSIFGGAETAVDMPKTVKNIGPTVRTVREPEIDPVDESSQCELRLQLKRLGDISDAMKLLQSEIVKAMASINDALKEPGRKKGPKSTLRVVLNGHLIVREHAADTLAEIVRRIGPERVSSLGLKLGGLPFVGMTFPPADRGYRTVEGWIVGTHASNADKKVVLEEMASRMDVDLQAEVLRNVE